MGGRSRQVKTQDRWQWVSELSEYRLQQYGLMSMHQSGDIKKDALNYALSNEYEARHGKKPTWNV